MQNKELQYADQKQMQNEGDMANISAMHAGMPAEAPQAPASAEEAEAEERLWNAPAGQPALGEAKEAPGAAGAEAQAPFLVPMGVVVAIPGRKAKEQKAAMTVRLEPELKTVLQSMARDRQMSLNVFCGAILEDVARQASGTKPAVA